MAGLSLIIPVESHERRPEALIRAMSAKPAVDLEILVVPASAEVAEREDLGSLGAIDGRVRIVTPTAPVASSLSLWGVGIDAAKADWLTVVRPDDIFEPETLAVADFVKSKLGTVDSIGWNALQINAGAEPGKSSSVAIPTKYDIVELNKTDMLKAFYLWEGSANVPKMPFGIYHAIISRELAQTVLGSIRIAGREHHLPQWEFAARAVLMGEKFAFCSRPLSVMNVKAYEAPTHALVRADFPFHAGIGLTAAIAEIQFSAFAEMGALWTGSQENFVRATIIDAMAETEPQAFNDKCNAYYRALTAWEGGTHAKLFRPQFAGERPLDKRRGLHGNLLMIDRHIAGARNAQEFYGIIRNFLVPVGIICGAQAV
ncbi:hypothetical protein [Rhizobium sp.]